MGTTQATAELAVLLVQARTDTPWWHLFCIKGEAKQGVPTMASNADPAPPAKVVQVGAVVRFNDTAFFRGLTGEVVRASPDPHFPGGYACHVRVENGIFVVSHADELEPER